MFERGKCFSTFGSRTTLTGLVLFFTSGLVTNTAMGLPAFAKREGVPCATCHTNGSAPHLNKLGYQYRRYAFHFPDNIGNKEADEKATLNRFFSAGINTDYEYVTNKPTGGAPSSVTSNQFNLPDLAIFPLVGGFLGNYGAFSEVDLSPEEGGGASLAMAEARAIVGDKKLSATLRTGYLTGEGYGAGDQWIDDGNLPLLDTLPAQHNENTLTLPFGAMGPAELGAELGLNCHDSFLTLGAYNGYDGSGGLSSGSESDLQPAFTNQDRKNSKDYRIQLDQMLWGDRAAFTLAWYTGAISLLDPSNKLRWLNSYSASRLYLTLNALPNTLELLAGGGDGRFKYVNSGSTAIAGHFHNRGYFLGFNYYAMTHLTLSARGDYYEYTRTGTPTAARGYALMINIPFENNLFVLRFNNTSSDIDGLTRDFRIEWRLFI